MHLITFTTQWIFIVYFCAIEFVVVRSSWTSNEVNKEPKYYLQSGSVYTVPWEWLITENTVDYRVYDKICHVCQSYSRAPTNFRVPESHLLVLYIWIHWSWWLCRSSTGQRLQHINAGTSRNDDSWGGQRQQLLIDAEPCTRMKSYDNVWFIIGIIFQLFAST